MHRIVIVVATIALSAAAQAGDVFVTKDAQGHPIYTDHPDSLPAERVNVTTKQTDSVDVQKRYAEQMKGYEAADKASAEAASQATEAKKAATVTAADKAKRCQEARTQYQSVMTARRVYEQGDGAGERRYLDSKEIDAARADAKKVMDEFCSGQ
jgi:hypothetical protein